MSSPYAAHDCLAIVIGLEKRLGATAPSEIHLFSYLSCLLSLYSGRPATDWEYMFAATARGMPYSYEVGEALGELVGDGYLTSVDSEIRPTESAHRLLAELQSMTECSWRRPYIEGACNTALALPVGVIRNAVGEEPGLRTAAALETSQVLLQGPSVHALHDHFAALSKSVGVEVSDLMVPSVVWLTYLGEVQHNEQTGPSGR
jgi:hypothetical protein